MWRFLAALGLCLALGACATATRYSAARDVHALLVSIRDEDRMGFEAHIDRPALKAEIEQRLVKASPAKARGLDGLAAILAPQLAGVISDTLIQPRVFRAIADDYGYKTSTSLPNSLAITGLLKTLPDGRICATQKKDGPCLLVFTRQDGTWKLSGFEGDMKMLRIKL